MSTETELTFGQLDLAVPVLKALEEIGYEKPSPIQAQAIPHLCAGRDVLGQAQTGTGKTAAFALPLLSRLDLNSTDTQVLVLAPTRELAIQVAEAFQSYAKHLIGFHVLPIYGGQSYDTQLRQLKRGAQVVVGTPGRVMDHLRRKTLKLDKLQAMVLDEADEMLRMGFVDDVEWILEHTPQERQIALFSATMPGPIRKIADRHLKDPQVVRIETATTTNENITQSYLPVKGPHKLDALTRILEAKPFDAAIIFVRTKNATVELAEKLEARGHSAAALNGDVVQAQRERTIDRLKKGQLDIVIATDVAARGIDVERVTLVVNYDIPYDAEAYTHRIGRTGRAGREGEAILFVAQREQRMLKIIEQTTRQKMEPMQLPTVEVINAQRISRFKDRIIEAVNEPDLAPYAEMVAELQQESELEPLQIAAALARLVQGDEPLYLEEKALQYTESDRGGHERGEKRERRPRSAKPEEGMVRYRLGVGRKHRVKPGNIVGAIANEGGIESKHIGPIEIYDSFTTVDLPDGMPRDVFETLKEAWVCGQRLNLMRDTGKPPRGGDRGKPARGGDNGKGRAEPHKKNKGAATKPKGKSKKHHADSKPKPKRAKLSLGGK